ncbi:hypothetical protein LRX75_05610 [Rhizobium sp. DKSPLA3]|uniref:Uncharacterized protein n=1 Tax=Rhizobium quercicola TaxID=2901226 RepID=A0A9X1NNV6_9HYPH|nr:hypothetical protein [Rhizobium quercicola]MCD7108517.1 hypothetical protein [Rhizobium quercicola]
MLSDVLADAETAIYRYQTEWPDVYAPLAEEIDAVRCRMILLQMRLDQAVSDDWLERNPIYKAAKAGDPGPHDAYMRHEDDSVLEAYQREFAAFLTGQSKS